MTIRARDLLFWLGILALFPLGVTAFRWAVGPDAGPVPPLGATLGGTPESVASRKADTVVRFLDESEAWGWANGCHDALSTVLTEQGYQLPTLSVSLTDDADELPLAVAYPDVVEPEALVGVGCAESDSGLTCQVAIGTGDVGPALNAATAVALAYGVADHYRDRSADGWAAQSSWSWADYRPLIEREGDGWRSTCLKIETR